MFLLRFTSSRLGWPHETVHEIVEGCGCHGATWRFHKIIKLSGRLLIANQQFIRQFNCQSAVPSHSSGALGRLKQLLICICILLTQVQLCAGLSLSWKNHLHETPTLFRQAVYIKPLFLLLMQQKIQTQEESSVYYRQYILCSEYSQFMQSAFRNSVQTDKPFQISQCKCRKAHIHGNCVLFSVKQVVRNNGFCIHEERSSRWINFLESNCFFLARWEDKRVRGTANIIVICIAIENCCGESFHHAADIYVKTLSGAKWVDL